MPGLQLPFKKVSGPWPKAFAVRAADGKVYAITVLHADDKGCELEYRSLPAAPQPAPGGNP